MAKKMVMPVAWAQDVDCWLETLKAAGFSDDTVRSRRYKIARLCRELPSPMETTGEQITRVFAAHADQVGDAMDEHARLAGTGTGEDEQRAVEVADGFALWRIEQC